MQQGVKPMRLVFMAASNTIMPKLNAEVILRTGNLAWLTTYQQWI